MMTTMVVKKTHLIIHHRHLLRKVKVKLFNAGRGTISSQARQERIARTEAETEARAAGQVPEAAVIPDVSQKLVQQ